MGIVSRNETFVRIRCFSPCCPSSNARTIDYDYMVITVSGSYTYGANVNYIPLPAPTSTELPNNTNCETSGYGYWQKVGNTPVQIAPTLQYTAMKCITIAECKKTWRTQTLTGRQQCAEQDNATSSMGDSGGPLTYMENGTKVLLGNVSWGHSQCAENGFPSAYSRNQEPVVNTWIKQQAGL